MIDAIMICRLKGEEIGPLTRDPTAILALEVFDPIYLFVPRSSHRLDYTKGSTTSGWASR